MLFWIAANFAVFVDRFDMTITWDVWIKPERFLGRKKKYLRPINGIRLISLPAPSYLNFIVTIC